MASRLTAVPIMTELVRQARPAASTVAAVVAGHPDAPGRMP